VHSSAGDLADAFVPPSGISGARVVISELCEENDRLKAANEKLQAELKASQALLVKKEQEAKAEAEVREKVYMCPDTESNMYSNVTFMYTYCHKYC
jgi:regulator of replication initiation timing